MRSIRTDLAAEAHDMYSGDGASDAVKREFNVNGFKITELKIGKNAAYELKKPSGTYLSADFGDIRQSGAADLKKAAEMICALMKMLVPDISGCVLAVGLGNDRVTPDSVGPKAMKKIIVTRHIKELEPALYESMGFGECAAVITGVLGETGVESADIIRSVAKAVKPELIIAIDALSARGMERMARTVQVTDAGIAPGSGVNNKRAEISQKSMGCRVISLGFPTVVDAATLTLDMLEGAGVDESVIDTADEKISGSGRPSLFVSPKDCDTLTDAIGDIASMAVNLFVHNLASLND